MRPQFIKARIKSGREDDARRIAQEFEEQSRTEGIGPTHVVVLQNQNHLEARSFWQTAHPSDLDFAGYDRRRRFKS